MESVADRLPLHRRFTSTVKTRAISCNQGKFACDVLHAKGAPLSWIKIRPDGMTCFNRGEFEADVCRRVATVERRYCRKNKNSMINT